jgi:uncharacterized protein YjiS (DUF1127 family)
MNVFLVAFAIVVAISASTDFKRKFENVRRDNGVLSAANSQDTAMFSSIVRHYRAWKRREAMRRELLHLIDRELKDIGIIHSDIERVVSQEIAEL